MLSRLYSWGRENAGLCDCTPVIINVQDMDYRLMMQESSFVGGEPHHGDFSYPAEQKSAFP